MADFTINGTDYQTRAMDGGVQLLLAKRLTPAFTALAAVINEFGGQAGLTTEAADGAVAIRAPTGIARMADALMPLARELAALPDDDVRFIMDTCLDLTSRRVAMGEGWMPVRQRGVIQDRADGEFGTRLKITWNVLLETFGVMLASLGVDLAAISGVATRLG